MLSSTGTAAEAASGRYELKSMLLQAMSNVVGSNNTLVPVTLLTRLPLLYLAANKILVKYNNVKLAIYLYLQHVHKSLFCVRQV
jgi:hypothetical protein